jgi:hypothetical protein
MTSRYAHIHDATMKDKLSEYLKGTLGATERDERAEANKPHQHRHNPGGKSWLGIRMV